MLHKLLTKLGKIFFYFGSNMFIIILHKDTDCIKDVSKEDFIEV